ncbi:MAG: alpha/beta hydrolase [Betaproteobacteria bacterium]
MKASNVLLLPGWQDSGPDHWQSVWERWYGYRRVQQHDWMRPLRGDWCARLEEVLLACDEPAVLVAHSLGCQLVAAWAAHSGQTQRVRAALLVAPPDVEREDLRCVLPSWSPIPLQPLPFKCVLLGSRDDPYCALQRTRQMAQAWGCEFVDGANLGHVNADSGLGAWDLGHDILSDLQPGPSRRSIPILLSTD